MVRIRLRRVGSKGQPSYRIVVADQRSPRDGRFIENIGHYNPRTEPNTGDHTNANTGCCGRTAERKPATVKNAGVTGGARPTDAAEEPPRGRLTVN